MPSMEDFRVELRAQIKRSADLGAAHVDLNAGDMHRSVGGYPGPDHRMLLCCEAMYQAMKVGDVVLVRPAEGSEERLVIRYRLPR